MKCQEHANQHAAHVASTLLVLSYFVQAPVKYSKHVQCVLIAKGCGTPATLGVSSSHPRVTRRILSTVMSGRKGGNNAEESA